MSASSKGRVVLWFRNDLRLHDNYVLNEAVKLAKDGNEIIPFYSFDDHFFTTSEWGSPKTGGIRGKFLLESVTDFKASLRGIGSDLLVTTKRPENAIPELSPTLVLTQSEVTDQEIRSEKRVREKVGNKAKLNLIWGSTLYHISDTPFKQGLVDMQDTFTPAKNALESNAEPRRATAAPENGALGRRVDGIPESLSYDFEPTLAELPFEGNEHKKASSGIDERAAMKFKGGEREALRRVEYYIWHSHLVKAYFHTRNGMLGSDYSTKLSPWLANGSLSPRKVHEEVKAFEKKVESSKSTYWVTFELTWRDYFKFFALKHGNALFYHNGTTGKDAKWADDPEMLKRWREGRTGWPLVDANMRELNKTGFMSNRGRQNVASYLVLDLAIDWRIGADFFENRLIDHDVCSNSGNWVAAAGMTGGRINRFNIPKQSKQYDPEGKYIRTWVPELKKVPNEYIHEPSTMPRSLAHQIGCVIGTDYPQPPPSRFKPSSRDNSGGGRGGRGKGRGKK